MEKEYKYKFSVIIAIYNVGNYLEEAILSVVNQDIGFEEHVQLILVNDGSPDNSDIICNKYKELYPHNIVYIKKENGGVSSARNEGMKFIEGKYMNFLDGDDKLDSNTLSTVEEFFEEVHDYIDVVSIPVYFFEAKHGNHILNYKYNKTRQINLLKEYKNIQLFINSVFIKSEFKDELKFNINMKYAEDAELVNKVLLRLGTLGVVNRTKYWYRCRADQSSAIQNGQKRKEWYIDYLNMFSYELINYSKKVKGYVPKFIQYTIMYDLQWRFNLEKIPNEVLNEEEQKKFMELLKKILTCIEDDIILEQKNISFAHKKYILNLKNEGDCKNGITKVFSPKNLELIFRDMYLGSIYNEQMKVDFMNIKQGKILLEGYITKTIFDEDYEIQIELNDRLFIADLVDRSINNQMSLGAVIRNVQGFKVEVPIDKNLKQQNLKIYLKVGNSRMRPKLVLGKFVRINQDFKYSYFITETHRVVFMYNSFNILKNGLKVNLGREYRLLKALIKKKEFKTVGIRLAYFFINKLKRKDIWILMDRIDKADDNAEHLFKYSLKQDDNVKKYFVIGKYSPDFERLKQYGKVVAYNSFYHKWLLLFANKVISSHIEDGIRVPFRGDGKYLRDLVNFKFVFLQHGITKDDLSKWLSIYNKNIDLFVTAVNPEYQSIIYGNYGYDEKVVKLTGFPRFDNLSDNADKQILIMPTWRNKIVNEINQTNGIRPYNEKFKYSDYCKKYNSLINNCELLNLAKENGYKIVFFPHPCIQQQIQDFNMNDQIIVPKYNESYQKMFNESSILITDYSSVAFDFAYLKKPVIYYQFDRDTFFKGHTYTEGYFSYEEMGFGPIYHEDDKLIQGIIECIENKCKMQDIYKKRVDSFYRYTDKNNCMRVYDEIRRLK